MIQTKKRRVIKRKNNIFFYFSTEERKSNETLYIFLKKTVCLLLALILTAAFVPTIYAAETEDELIKGAFTMVTFDGFDPGEQAYYYSDSYFASSGKGSNAHLRTMSAA